MAYFKVRMESTFSHSAGDILYGFSTCFSLLVKGDMYFLLHDGQLPLLFTIFIAIVVLPCQCIVIMASGAMPFFASSIQIFDRKSVATLTRCGSGYRVMAVKRWYCPRRIIPRGFRASKVDDNFVSSHSLWFSFFKDMYFEL
jgi:hypothetical protein